MKKFILLCLLFLVGFTVTVDASAAGNKIVDYELVPSGNIVKNEYYLIKYFFRDDDDIAMHEELCDHGLISDALCDTTYEAELKRIGYEASPKVIELIKTVGYGDHFDYNLFYLVKAAKTQDGIGDYDSSVSEVYKAIIGGDPVIEGNEVHYINYDSLLSLAEIEARYHASDNFDKDLTSAIKFETNYPENKDDVRLGEYYIKATVTDSSGNSASVTNKIIVDDTTAPVFSGEKSYIKNYGETFTIDDLKNSLSCNDNYEKVIPSSKFQVRDNKTINPNSLDKQYFTIYYADSKGNEGTYDVIVQFIDKVDPVITVDGLIDVSTLKPLNEEEVIAILRDGNKIPKNYRSATIESEYFNHQDEVGIFTSLCTVITNDGDTIHYRFKIDVKDTALPTETNLNALWISLGTLGGVSLLTGAGILIYYLRKRKALANIEKM